MPKILSTDNINELDLKDSKTCDFKHSDERKYSIVYRFMAEDERWKKFTVIEASSIIFHLYFKEHIKICSII